MGVLVAKLGGNPTKPTLKPKYTVMYFLGAEHLALAFAPMWDRIGAKYGNNHKVAATFPNDADGNAFRAVFPAVLKPEGYTLDLSTAYADGLTNYTSMISKFKSDGDDFFTNVPLPPDFATMWTQALQQGFKPKLATVAKVLLFPTDAYALGSKAYNIATDAWWVPELPWTSSLTGQTCPELAAAYTAAGLGQPNQNISNYTLFEIAYQAFTLVDNPKDKSELATALYKVKLPQAVAGPIDYTSANVKTNPAPGVAITLPVGIQWWTTPCSEQQGHLRPSPDPARRPVHRRAADRRCPQGDGLQLVPGGAEEEIDTLGFTDELPSGRRYRTGRSART